MLPGLIYKQCQLELAGILVLENINEIQHSEACLDYIASKCLLGDLSGTFANYVNPSHNTP